jgi:hypothetical protein
MMRLLLSPEVVAAVAAPPAPVAVVPPAAVPAVVPAASTTPWNEPPKPPAAAPTPEVKPPVVGEVKEAPKPPEKFVLKAPEGVKLEPAYLEKAGADYQALGVTQDAAQKLLERDLAAQKAAHESNVSAIKQTNDQWAKDLQADKDFGGTKFSENAEMAKRGLDYVDPDGSMRKAMETLGVNNWPPFVKSWAKVGRMLAEDKLHAPTNAIPDRKLTPEERMAQGYRDRMGQKK